MKTAGMILIFITAASAGAYMSGKYSQRCGLLNCIMKMLDRTAIMIRYSALPVEDIIRGLASDDAFARLEFLPEVGRDIADGGDFREIWRDRLDEWFGKKPFCEEYAILSEFGKNLGASDTEGQLSCIAAEKKTAERCMLEAENDRLTKGKLCRSMGVLIGLGAVLILL